MTTLQTKTDAAKAPPPRPPKAPPITDDGGRFDDDLVRLITAWKQSVLGEYEAAREWRVAMDLLEPKRQAALNARALVEELRTRIDKHLDSAKVVELDQ